MQVWPPEPFPLETGPRHVPVPWDPSYYHVLPIVGVAEAPQDGQNYVRNNGQWVVLPECGPALWIGNGAPPDPPPAGARPGIDHYLDIDSGDFYVF